MVNPTEPWRGVIPAIPPLDCSPYPLSPLVKQIDLIPPPTPTTMKSRRCLTVLASLFALTASARAQTVSATSPSPSNPGGVVELTPFIVNTDKDTGYAASETLAGTRMRNDLRDVGAALTILTPEFLQDLAVNSFDQALIYTPSVDLVEGDNTDANRASGTAMRYGTGQSFSIRGFNTNAGNQSISHDFFTALETADNYNSERITLSLGPNALLIGVGNPQGTVVTTTKRAQLQRQKTTVEAQTDRWGSARLSLDHNQLLIRDKLALRLNLLHDQHREFRKFEGKDQERMTVSVTAQPWANTRVTLNHESYTVHTNASSLMWGFNSGMLRWLAAGKPAVDFVPAGLTYTATRAYVDAKGNRIPVAPGVVDADGFVDAKTDFDPNNALGQTAGHTQVWVVGLPMANPLWNMRYQGTLSLASFGGQNSANYQSMNPWEMIGISKDTNLNGGTWDDPSNKQHGRWSQLLVEQKITEGLYLELAGNVAVYHQNLDPNNFTSITIDPNRYLPDGSLNPGYLVPYDENGQMQFRPITNKVAEYRATLSYERDLTKINRWFGKHSLSGLYQTSRSDADQDLTRVFNLATVGRAGAGWSPDAVNATNLLRTRVYFLNGNVPIMPDSVQVQKYIATLNGYGSLQGATANESAPVNLSRQSFLSAIKSRFDDDSLSLGWQAKWLANRLVTVVGYRKDTTDSYGVQTQRDVILSDIPGAATNPVSRYFALAKDVPYDANPTISADGISRTYGAVLHALPWLSFTYNRSSNFLPVTNASWRNALGEPAPNSAGKTEEYGVRLSLLQGKLSVGLSRFETSADDQSRNANGSVGPTRNILTRLRANYNNAGDSHFTDLQDVNYYPVDTGNVSDTWSYVAEGYELNVTYNPSPRWRIALSGSSNTNTLGTHLQALGRYLATDSKFEGLGTYRKFVAELNKVVAGQRSAFFDLDPANPAHKAQAEADAIYIQQQVDTQDKNYRDDQSLVGITTARNGKYAVNGLITHVFANEGRLKGWSVGTNFRWRSANTIGYEDIYNANGSPSGLIDVARPMKGKDYWDLGAMISYRRRVFKDMNMRVQLNIQNLPDWQSPRLVKSDYDTMGLYGTVNQIVPILWEVRRPRNFILTTAFDF